MKIKRYNEEFTILYEDNDYLLVRSENNNDFGYGPYSFGLKKDFYSFYWFPVNQSCLHKKEAIERLNNFIKIDVKYKKLYPPAEKTILLYKKMIKAIEEDLT